MLFHVQHRVRIQKGRENCHISLNSSQALISVLRQLNCERINRFLHYTTLLSIDSSALRTKKERFEKKTKRNDIKTMPKCIFWHIHTKSGFLFDARQVLCVCHAQVHRQYKYIHQIEAQTQPYIHTRAHAAMDWYHSHSHAHFDTCKAPHNGITSIHIYILWNMANWGARTLC